MKKISPTNRPAAAGPLPCTDPAFLQRYLRDELGEADENRVADHVGACPACQRALERAAGDDSLWQGLGASLAAPGARDADGGVEDALQEVRRHLAPSDDPASLGRLGHYEVRALVGAGSTGIVLKAFEPRLDRYVAIKLMAPRFGGSGAARRRFEREARAVAAVAHDHVVPIHSVDEYRGLPYIVMRYVPGGSLQQRLDRDGPLDSCAAARVGLQVARALAAAHAVGIVHRDVKPANVLLEDRVERAMVSDFGLARVADEVSMTRSGTITGTPQFMSPEQARGDAVDHRSDLFSLGSTLWAACAGHPPFRAQTLFGVIHRVSGAEPRALREVNPAIDEWLAALIARLMAKRPEDRFASAAAAADALAAELARLQNPTGAPVPARDWFVPPAPAAGGGRNRTKRWWTALAAGGLFAVGLALAWDRGEPDDATGGRRAGFAVGAAGAAQDPAGAPLPGAEVRWRDPRATAGDAPGDDAPLFEQRITRSFAIGDDASFTIDADTGNLLVAAAADGERALRLEIVQRVAASDQEAAARLTRAHRYALEQGEHGVVLRATLDPEAGAARAALRASEFRITVPRGCTTRLETRDGDIVVGGLRSDLQARTHRGGIHLARIDGAVNAEARGGDVVLAEGCSGAVDVLAVQGDAIVAGVVGEANVRASGGNIRLGPSAGRVYAQTSGGDIDVDGVEGATGGFALGGSVAVRIDRAPTANCAFSATGGGDVRLTVGDGVAIDLAARGELASPFPTESVEDDDGNGPPWQVSRLAGGGVRVRLSSSTGRVLVQPGGPQGNGPEGSGPDGSGPSGSGLGGSGLGGSGSGDARPTLTAAARARTSGPPRPGALATVTLPDSAGGIDGYTIYLPPAHATDGDPYPVIVYLQGGYGVGGPIENVNDWGLPRLVRDAGEPATERDHLLLERFVVVALHLTEGQYGEHQETVRQVLADVLASWNGDPARVYLTGLSRGGHGTWELAERLRGTFAAIVPIGGSAEDVEDWDALAGTAIWISHNRGDTIVPFAATADAVANVERQFGVEFRRYDRIDVAGTDYLEQRYVLTAPDVDNHDAWTDLYTRPEIYRWLLAQSRAATAARSYR